MSSDEKVIGSMPVYNFDEDRYITVFTKHGMVKRTKLCDFKVGRYTKEISMIKLATDDMVIAVDYSNNNDVFVATQKGYGLWYDISEVSVVGIRASGVKSIKLKDDEVKSSMLFNPECEYITIITDKGTAKRLKLSEISKASRANKGILLMKEIKSNPSKILDCYIIPSKEEITVRSIAEEKTIKLTEIAIMDRQSNGSFVVKDRIVDTFKNAKLVDSNDEKVVVNDVQEKKEPVVTGNREYRTLKNIDEKMMSIDEYLNGIEK